MVSVEQLSKDIWICRWHPSEDGKYGDPYTAVIIVQKIALQYWVKGLAGECNIRAFSKSVKEYFKVSKLYYVRHNDMTFIKEI